LKTFSRHSAPLTLTLALSVELSYGDLEISLWIVFEPCPKIKAIGVQFEQHE
jgi:hypothetical protein